jgi:hypothetical protein
MVPAWVRLLFALTGVYDFGIGLAFLTFGPRLFAAAGVTPPNHWGYVEFGALMLMTFGAVFFAVAARPAANRNLIPFGILFKLSYVGVVAYHWIAGDVPDLFKPFAVVDGAMVLLFVAAYVVLGRPRPA